MDRFLFVGDPHATQPELADCHALVELVRKTAVNEKVDGVVWLGDMYHNHAVLSLFVLDFWMDAFREIPGIEQIALVGNHDRPGVHGSKAHALRAHEGQVRVIDKPTTYKGLRWVPYMPSNDEFYAACQEGVPSATLICHQTFNGGVYDNGFYAKDGADPQLVPQAQVLSGHIHLTQEFDKVWYPGAPRWRTASDANVERNLWVVDFENGSIVNRKPIPTGPVCRRIYVLEDTEAKPLDAAAYDTVKDDVRVTISGTSEYVDKRKLELAAQGVKVKAVKNDAVHTKVRESEGVDVAFRRYVSSYVPQHGANKAALESLVSSRFA